MTRMTYPSRRIWLQWRGDDYLGRETLAKAAGVNIKTIDYHLRTHGHLELMGTGNRGRKSPKGPAKPIRIGDREWPSITALAKELGAPRSSVSKMVSNNREKLMSLLLSNEGGRTQKAMSKAGMVDHIRRGKSA